MKKILILMLLLLVVATMFADRKYNNGQFIMETNGDVDMTGNYLLDSQSITNLASKGASYWFDGTDDYIGFGDDPDFEFTTAMSASINAKTNVPDLTTVYSLINKYATSGTREYYLYIDTNEKLTLTLSANGASTEVSFRSDSAIPNVDKWNNYTFTYDGTDIIFYVNGVPISASVVAGTIPSSIFNGAANLYVGATQTGATYLFGGEIYNVKLFNLTLTATEVKDLYSGAELPYKYVGASQTSLVTGDNSTFASDTGFWSKKAGTTIGSGVAEITALGNILSSINNWSLNKPTLFTQNKQYRITFDARQTTGSGNFQSSIGYGGNFDQAITGSFVTYSYETNATGVLTLIFGGSTATDVFELDNVMVIPIGNVANYSSDGVGHNTWSDVSGNNLYGTVSGAVAINMEYQQDIVRVDGVSSDTQLNASSNIVPAGYLLKYIIVTETDGGDPVLDFGTTDGGSDIFDDHAFVQNTMETVIVNEVLSLTEDKAVWVTEDGAGWDSGSIDIIIISEKVQ